MIRLGVIGYGRRIQNVIDMLHDLSAGAEVVAVTDVRDNDEIKREMSDRGRESSRVNFYTDPDKMLDTERLDGVLIGTRCSMHAKMAVKVIARDLPLYLEKPVATNMSDLLALRDAARSSEERLRREPPVIVSFPLRVTPLVQIAKEIIDSGQIGTVEHVQAWNNVPYGWEYFQTWYRDADETGGLWLQKATHDFDYINYVLGAQPVRLCAMDSKRVYKGDHPAGLRCDDCDEWDSCLESPFHRYFTRHETRKVEPGGLLCAFAVDALNEDSGSAIIEYESGMHVCYSQNFFVRGKAAKRGARFLGYKGTVEFDWYTEEIDVYMHHAARTQKYNVQSAAVSHGGGDEALVDNFVRVIRGEQTSVAPLSAGLLSVLMCLKAKESATSNTFQEISFSEWERSK